MKTRGCLKDVKQRVEARLNQKKAEPEESRQDFKGQEVQQQATERSRDTKAR